MYTSSTTIVVRSVQIRLSGFMFNLNSMQTVKFADKTLYCLGNTKLLHNQCVAVIGSRKLSRQGMLFDKDITARICKDFTIVSGLAIGADTIAHQTAIKLNKPQIAVLPCGFNNITPRRNIKIALDILQQGGLLVSEYSPNTQATKNSYLARNEIIAQIAKMLVIVECSAQSGTMNTVRCANKLNKKLFAYLPTNPSKHFKADGPQQIINNYNGQRMTK